MNKRDQLARKALSGRYLAVASAAIAGLSAAWPVAAQGVEPPAARQIEEVVVTARRKEESIQDVPIAISVYSQEELDRINVTSGADLALYNPSLSANNRFGSDQSSFAIRGFTQELRTTASVGVYFAEVVAPRGSGLIAGGDGAGPGSFFDLQNVQILKGPQGTLFGRNTTGGAILLTPQKPTDALEGYLEVGGGNYDLERLQGAINVPLGDRARSRFAFDSMKRDGYLRNVSGVGPDRFADVDYITGRASLVVDLSDDLENYTIVSYTDSENNGVVASLFGCNEPTAPGTVGLFSAACTEQLATQGDDFHTVMSINEEPVSKSKQWQVINTTTWTINDSLTAKNIISYADVEQHLSSAVFGAAWSAGGIRFPFTASIPIPGIPSNSQTSFVEELQFQGVAFDSRLTWQAGLYYESNRPDGPSGTVSPFFAYCDPNPGADPNQFNCLDAVRLYLYELNNGNDGNPVGNIQRGVAKVEFTSKAVFGEATYSINDALALTGGLRYTKDETDADAQQIVYMDLPPAPGGYSGGALVLGPPTDAVCGISTATLADGCRYQLSTSSEAVTGQVSLNYFLSEQVTTYAKYARGYRQGSLNVLMAEGLQTYDPEQVDSYEIGAKSSFNGAVPGTLNLAVFYNDLQDQQLQQNVVDTTNNAVSTTAIINAGKSMIAGVELEATLRFPWDMQLAAAYTYLDTELKEYTPATLPPGSRYNQIQDVVVEGGELTFSPENNLTATLSQYLPVPAEWGDMSVGVTYVYTDEQLSTANSPLGVAPAYELWNLNFAWTQIVGSGFDLSVFVTNAKDEEVTNYVNGLYNAIGSEYRIVGEPRMYGAKIRYTFGT